MTNRFQKFAFSVNSTRPHEADTVSIFKSLRFHRFRPVHTTPCRHCCVFKSFHSGDCFRKFAFSSKTIHRFHHFRVDGTWKRNKMFVFSNENASVWTGPDALGCRSLQTNVKELSVSGIPLFCLRLGTWLAKLLKIIVYTKSVNSVFRALWLATRARNI